MTLPGEQQMRVQSRTWTEWLRLSWSFFGAACLWWIVICLASGCLLVLVEYSVVVFLQLFVLAIGVGKSSMLSPWVPDALRQLSLGWLLVGLLLIGLMRFLAYLTMEIAQSALQERVLARMRFLTLYELLFIKEPHRVLRAGDVNYRFGELLPSLGLFSIYLANGLFYFVLCCLLLAGMMFLSPKEAMVSLVGVGGIGVVILWLSREAKRLAALLPGYFAEIQKGIERVARNRLLVQILGTQEREHALFRQTVRDYFGQSMHSFVLVALASNIAPLLGILMISGVVYVSFTMFGTSGVQLLAFLYIFVRFIQQMRLGAGFLGQLNRHWPRYAESVDCFYRLSPTERTNALAAYEQLPFWSMSQRSAHKHLDEPSTPTVELDAVAPPAIDIDNVSFRYDEEQSWLFRSLSLSMAAGEQYGIVGRSGTGKSSLLSLILGVWEPVEGSIRIAGVSPSAWLEAHPMAVGYVGPEPFLLDGSIRDNLLYGFRSEPDEGMLWEALELAHIDHVVREAEGQLDAPMTADGSGFSAGEKQRFALARALLRKPALLILDEASANLDAATEKQIVATLRQLKGRTTILIVSHREGLLEHVSECIRLASE
jgi:ATP-binding cassette subfamily C protein